MTVDKKERKEFKRKRSRKYFDELVSDYAVSMYNRRDSAFSNQLIKSNIKSFDSIFSDLRKIHKEKQKHDLHWAFDHANKEFHYILQKILKVQFFPKIQMLVKRLEEENKSSKEFKKSIKVLKQITKHKEKVFKRKAQYFIILSNFITGIDIVISVFLILLISEIAHYLNAVINSWVLGIIFVGIIALFKVTLDRFWIIPKVTKLGWRLYIRTIQHYKEILARYEVMSLVVSDAIDKGVETDEILKMLEYGIIIIRKETIRHRFLGLL